MTAGRLKAFTILGVLLLSALAFLAWSQSWGTLVLVDSTTNETVLDVPGSVAAPALSALGLAGIALAGALAIAGPAIRIVLGVLEVLLGVSVLWSAIGALSDPVAAGASVVTTSTGVAGTESIRELATAGPASPWPVVTAVLGALMMLAGITIILFVRRWPQAGRKYQVVTYEAADGRRSSDPAELIGEPEGEEAGPEGDEAGPAERQAGPSASGSAHASASASAEPPPAVSARDAAVDDWDSLTRGTDPTR